VSPPSRTTELDSPPSLPGLYAGVLAGLIPGGGEELPEHTIVLRGAKLDPERVAAYARVCGFGVRDAVPGTFPHVIGFPLQLKLMTERSFPFSALGLVHIANRIEVLAPVPLGARLDLAARAENLRPHRLGRQLDMVVEAELDGKTAWKGRSTYLRRGGGGSANSGGSTAEGEDDDVRPELTTTALWRVPGHIGRAYASVSGDRNPIHLHPLTARAFGFPSAIAHGMWTQARCLAAFEGRVPDAYAIEARFKAPLRIPGEARLLTGAREDGWDFAVESVDGERVHAVGSISISTA
jgi:acyl dehydratase